MGPDTQPSTTPAIPRRRFLRWLLGFSVVSGPPPAPLPSVAVSVEGDQVFLVSA